MTLPAILGLISSLVSAAAAADEDDADRLLRAAVGAQGSAAAIAAVRSLTAVADCTGPGGDHATFVTEVVSLLPDRAMFRQTAAGQTVELFVAGDRGWMRDAPSALAKPLPESLFGVVRGHEFHRMFLELDRRSRNPRAAGRDTVDGKPCLVVSATDSGGRPTSVCIDEATKLPARLSFEPSGGPKPQTIHVFPSGWTEVAGIRWIDGFTLKQGDEVFTYKYKSIRPNSVDPKLFDVPKEIAALTPSPRGRGSG
jgi:hypothetical protein